MISTEEGNVPENAVILHANLPLLSTGRGIEGTAIELRK
jgi:hypothetical protein